MSRTVLLLAGEASGDAYGGALARALRDRLGAVRMIGTGGAAMGAQGVDLVAGLDDLAVMGFAEVVPRLAYFRRLERRLTGLLREVDLVVPIDYPGLNLRIARAAKRAGLPVLWYVAPKVWAWWPARARALAVCTDQVAAILPFEPDFLAAFGVRATYVGHPLLDREGAVPARAAFMRRWKLDAAGAEGAGDATRPVLALLPGSRRQEVERHLDLFTAAAELVRSERPDVLPVVGRARALPADLYARAPFPAVDDVRALLAHAGAALVKSGTVTLEAALEGTPSVVAYRTSALSWAVAKRLLRVEHVALPNLVLGTRAVPEYLQARATPESLAAALLPLLDASSPERAAQLEAFARVRSALGGPGATGRVAELAARLLGVPA